MKTKTGELTAASLRTMLWETMQGVRDKKIEPRHAEAIASQGREILRSFKTQLQILASARKRASGDMVRFAKD